MFKRLILVVVASCISINVFAADPAVVNGEPINQSLLDFIANDAATHGQKIDDNARAAILDKLITGAIIEQEAVKSGLLSEPDYQSLEKLTLREIRVKTYITHYLSKHPIDESALTSEYEKLKQSIDSKEYKASHILVKTEAEAKDIISQLGKGADFAKLAKEKSQDNGSKEQGGSLGWFSKNDMVKPFSDAAITLGKGATTKTPVQTEFGWHVIRLEDTREVQPPTLEAVKNDLLNNLRKQQVEKMIEELRAKANITKN